MHQKQQLLNWNTTVHWEQYHWVCKSEQLLLLYLYNLLSKIKKWLGNLSTNLDPGANLLLRESNKGKILLSWLLAPTMELLICNLCLEVMFSKKRFDSMIVRRIEVFSWCISLSFWRCKWIGINLVMALIYRVEEV